MFCFLKYGKISDDGEAVVEFSLLATTVFEALVITDVREVRLTDTEEV